MTDTFLAQIFSIGPFDAEDTPPRWLDYARGTEQQTIEWASADPANRRVVDWIDKSKILWPTPLPPMPDSPGLRVLLAGSASLWDDGPDAPSWRDNEYMRGQVELINEICRVLTDQEIAEGSVDIEEQRDRIQGWITGVSHHIPARLFSEPEWMATREYEGGGEIEQPRALALLWGDASETPSQAIQRLNSEAMEWQAVAVRRLRLLQKVITLFTERVDKPLVDDTAGVRQDAVRMYASPEWYQEWLQLTKTIKGELAK